MTAFSFAKMQYKIFFTNKWKHLDVKNISREPKAFDEENKGTCSFGLY